MDRSQHIAMPSRLLVALGAIVMLAVAVPATANAQGLVQGVQQGAREGNKAAGPVGGVLGGAIGGVVGVVTGVTGVFTGGNNKGGQAPAAKDAKQGEPSKQGEVPKQGEAAKQGDAPKSAKGSKATKTAARQPPQQPAVLTQPGAPQLTAEQIVATSDANIERIKKELNLTPEQEKHWAGFNSAMHYLGHNGAERLNLRVARAKRDPPDDIIEQMRNEAQFLNDRAVDQRNVADAAEPLFASLSDKQKEFFIQEMVKLSHERGLD
ncbi:Spy/CpxP family protein refolding chaperone [Bradyrhizobium sp. CB3481]|uniref:Spy/CpxP family protein refolding chaperone n=1 Tax=Bradyrhizobium sp. CB3481 TaxID=3039158 RepID=UPI0024B0E8EE|nr:Spy/CpxP family protein refolding chaperone [Bradyrhizobium sp. CB3481]WFU20534.1 Spy/CpxP family protein refolding chaperone [Bradyrhizobium sp. CB3481]